jgi:hypothetical protein
MGAKLLRGSTIVADTTPVTVTGADQDLKVWNIAENKFEAINVMLTVVITTTGTSGVQTLDIEVLNGTTVVFTFNVRTAAAINTHNLPINVDIVKRNKGTISVRLGNGTIDAQTSVLVRAGKLLGID